MIPLSLFWCWSISHLRKKKNISFLGWFILFDFFISLGLTDRYILTAMAYDCYIAICKPLAAKCPEVSASLVATSYIYGFTNGLTQTILRLYLSFCGPSETNHFYCVDPPLLVLACSDTNVSETAMFVVAGSNLMFSLTTIHISNIFTFTANMQMHSPEGRPKALSTCGSQLTVVTMFYGTLFWI